MQRGVHDDPRRAEEGRLVLEEEKARLGEESLLAHDPFGVEPPALGEIGGEVRPPDGRRILLRHHQVPVMAGIGLMHGGRGDTRGAVALEALLHFLGWRAVRRVGHEEVTVQGVGERGRLVVARHGLDRPLEVRGRLDRATLALGKRDEAGVAEERARPLRPVGVLLAHRIRRRSVHAIQPLARRHPVAAAIDLLRDLVRFAREQVVLLAAALAEVARTVGEELLFPEERGVEVLADRVVAGRAALVLAEVGREVVVRVRGGPARGGDPLAIRRVRDLRRHELARVPGRRLRLSDRPLDVDPGREGEVDVRFAVGDVLPSRLEPRARRVRELALGPQTMEEEGEHALERRVQVGVRLALPLRARLHELAAAQRREHRVPIDPLPRVQVRIGDRPEPPGPLQDARIAPAEGLRRQVFRAFVVLGQPERARPARRLLVPLLEVIADERGERGRRHDPTSERMAEDPQ